MDYSTLFARGNLKVPTSTWIFNAGAATDCPSRRLGLCQCPSECYALKAERVYKQCLPYRRRQHEVSRTMPASEVAGDVIRAAARARVRPTLFRFNEAGDFEDQRHVDWFVELARLLRAEAGIRTYGYTARTDLDLVPLIQVAHVQVSNDRGHWVARGANRFIILRRGDKPTRKTCAGNCRVCRRCYTHRGLTVGVQAH